MDLLPATLFCLACLALAAWYARRSVRMKAALNEMTGMHATTLGIAQEEARLAGEKQATIQAEFEVLLNRSEAGVLALDQAGLIERANPKACELLCLPGQTPVGKSLLQATLSEEIDAMYRAARDGACSVQRELRAPGCAQAILIVSIAPVPPAAESKRCLVIARDVTDLRRLETIRRDFVANVSHELRTPLASIRAMAETLQQGAREDSEVADRFLHTIINETERLSRIAEDLLILSDAESRPTEEKTPFNLSALILEVVERFQPQAERAGIALTADVPAGLTAEGNPDQLEQVVVNLVDNALKYTPGGGQVRVTAERKADSVTVHIADTGIGILSQDLPRIFERFYRVDKARSRRSGGTGLGLSIVKHIVEAHGGKVTVDSNYNHGSVFSFSLPVKSR